MSKDTMTLAEFREKKREAEEAIEKILNKLIGGIGVRDITVEVQNLTVYTQGNKTSSCSDIIECTIVAKL